MTHDVMSLASGGMGFVVKTVVKKKTKQKVTGAVFNKVKETLKSSKDANKTPNNKKIIEKGTAKSDQEVKIQTVANMKNEINQRQKRTEDRTLSDKELSDRLRDSSKAGKPQPKIWKQKVAELFRVILSGGSNNQNDD